MEKTQLLMTHEEAEAKAEEFVRVHGKSLVLQLGEYADLLASAKNYRETHPDVDALLTGIERGEWEAVAEMAYTASSVQFGHIFGAEKAA